MEPFPGERKKKKKEGTFPDLLGYSFVVSTSSHRQTPKPNVKRLCKDSTSQLRSTTDTIRHDLLGFVALGPISISQACGEPGTAAARATLLPCYRTVQVQVQVPRLPGSVQLRYPIPTYSYRKASSLNLSHFLFSFTHFVSAARAWLNSSRIKISHNISQPYQPLAATYTQVVERGSRNLNLQPQVSLARISYPPFPSALNSRRYSFGTSLLVRVRKIRLFTFLRLFCLFSPRD
jgi:hypothetical protein